MRQGDPHFGSVPSPSHWLDPFHLPCHCRLKSPEGFGRPPRTYAGATRTLQRSMSWPRPLWHVKVAAVLVVLCLSPCLGCSAHCPDRISLPPVAFHIPLGLHMVRLICESMLTYVCGHFSLPSTVHVEIGPTPIPGYPTSVTFPHDLIQGFSA